MRAEQPLHSHLSAAPSRQKRRQETKNPPPAGSGPLTASPGLARRYARGTPPPPLFFFSLPLSSVRCLPQGQRFDAPPLPTALTGASLPRRGKGGGGEGRGQAGGRRYVTGRGGARASNGCAAASPPPQRAAVSAPGRLPAWDRGEGGQALGRTLARLYLFLSHLSSPIPTFPPRLILALFFPSLTPVTAGTGPLRRARPGAGGTAGGGRGGAAGKKGAKAAARAAASSAPPAPSPSALVAQSPEPAFPPRDPPLPSAPYWRWRRRVRAQNGGNCRAAARAAAAAAAVAVR